LLPLFPYTTLFRSITSSARRSRASEEASLVSTEPPTTTGALARLGFSSTDRVRRFLAEPALAGLADGAAAALGRTADGDDAVLGLLRLAEAAQEAGQDALLTEF